MRTHLRLLASAALAAAALAAAPAAAKPVYLTVPRAFGTDESPTIDVAFQARGPVELRVLQPEPLDAFLAGQLNVRRAYVTPLVKDNPARWLARGLNESRLPGTFVYRALDEELRKELGPTLPPRPQRHSERQVVQLAEGPEKLVDAPAGTKLVRRVWLNLDLGGGNRDYTVPGFEAWSLSSAWEERKVALDPLPPGVYLVQLVQGKVEGQVVLVVTDLRVQVKQTDGQALVRVAGKDGAPVAGAEVKVRTTAGPGPTGKTDKNGEVRLKVKEPRLVVLVQAGADRALVDTDFYSTLAATPDVFVYTDRPIYRPGDAVKYRGIVRQPDTFLSRLFRTRARQVDVALQLASGEVSGKARIDEYGSFSGELAVPEDVPSGVVRLTAKVDEAPHGADARVDEYVKPTFYLEVSSDTEAVRPGEPITAKIRARRYSGGAPEGARYEVFLYRSLLDGPAWVDDAGLGAQGSAVTYGSASTTEGKLSVPERLYSTIEDREAGASEDPWANAPTFDEKGEAEVVIPVPGLRSGDDRLPWRYTLSVRARDDQGTFASAGRPFFLAPSEVMGVVRPGAAVALAGGEAPLAVRATTLSGAPYAGATGTVEFVLRRADGSESDLSETKFTCGPDGVWRGAMPAPKAGTVVARVTLADKAGHPWTGEGSLLVVGKGGEESVRVPALQAAGKGDPLVPGDEGELVALFPSGWGPGRKDRGKVWVTASGTGIFDTRVVDVDGLSLVYRFPVERRYGSAVYVSVAYPTAAGRWEERTVPFRIVPPERLLSVKVSAERPEAEPLGPQTLTLRVTDHEGRGVRAQVSVGVVDKAIYALQGELRPRVIDFFYPLVRNNVATFTSAEFQGYGYGELLARAFQGPGHAFAAVKPPTKVREVDTAYWNPAVVTDEDGRAAVTFTLPSNQTIWTVTAVAADVSGRFGESTSEFTARGGTFLVASAPLFLREGDTAVGSVRLSRPAKDAKKSGPVQLAVSASGALAGRPVQESVTLAPGAERVVPVPLEGKQSGSGRVTLALTGGDRPLSDQREVPVRPLGVEQLVTASAFGGGKLALELPPGAKVESVELSLRPSTVALALSQVEELLTYPHGCLEQLVATTIPNIALHRVLETTGAAQGLDPAARALLAEARSRAAQGIDRILALAKPAGGFTWFSGAEQASVPLTLIALDGLAHAIDAKLVARDDPRITASARWLERFDGLPLPLDATRAYVLARLDGPRQAARVRALLDRLGEAPSGDLYPLAMAVLAADRAGIAKEPLVRARIAVAATRSKDLLVQPVALRFDTPEYYAYPLRRAGLVAVLAHAASLGEIDVGVARRRLFEALGDRAALSTFERSTALLHSLWLIERDAKALRTDPAPKVDAEGGPAPTFEVRGAARWARLAPTVKAVRVAEFDGQAELRARVVVPLAATHATAEGMSVERRYWRLLPGGEKRALRPGDKLAQGEEVWVELVLDAHEGDQYRAIRSAYYVVEDAVPAGFTPLGEDKAYRGAPYSLPLAHESLKRRSLSPERALFYLEEPAWWSRSPRTVGYVIRAQFPGRFSAPPATIEDMYAPKIHGRSEPAVLEVVASAAR